MTTLKLKKDMATLQNNKNTVRFNFGGELEFSQVQSICSGNAGNRATDEEVKEYLINEGWEKDNINEFLEFINSDLVDEMSE